jgi:hypothetical protein
MRLAEDGFALVDSGLAPDEREALRSTLFKTDRPGIRCLLDDLLVRVTAGSLRTRLCSLGILPPTATAIQAISFDKTPETNWKVSWHQDLMFPFARPVTSEGYELPSEKEGVNYARPPRAVLEEMLAVRIHLDDCDATSGPLNVTPGSHVYGVLRNSDIPAYSLAASHRRVACIARAGEALLMRPLLLHASSPATKPSHRRVLHLVYHSGSPMTETWYRSIQ